MWTPSLINLPGKDFFQAQIKIEEKTPLKPVDMRTRNKALEIIIALGMILAFPIVMPIAWGYKLYTHLRMKETAETLAAYRKMAVFDAIDKQPENEYYHYRDPARYGVYKDSPFHDRKDSPLYDRVKKILKHLHNSHGDTHVSMQKVREEILESPSPKGEGFLLLYYA